MHFLCLAELSRSIKMHSDKNLMSVFQKNQVIGFDSLLFKNSLSYLTDDDTTNHYVSPINQTKKACKLHNLVESVCHCMLNIFHVVFNRCCQNRSTSMFSAFLVKEVKGFEKSEQVYRIFLSSSVNEFQMLNFNGVTVQKFKAIV